MEEEAVEVGAEEVAEVEAEGTVIGCALIQGNLSLIFIRMGIWFTSLFGVFQFKLYGDIRY